MGLNEIIVFYWKNNINLNGFWGFVLYLRIEVLLVSGIVLN